MDKAVYTYVCVQGIYVPAASTLFFPTEHDVQERQHLRDEVGSWQRTTQNNGLSFLSTKGEIITKTVSFGITDG